MSARTRFVQHSAFFASVVLLLLQDANQALAHGGAHPGGHSSPRPSPTTKHDKPDKPVGDLKLGANMIQPAHGGRVVATKWHYFEVVYTPNETRVYLYSPSKRPLNPARVQGEVTMRISASDEIFRYPLLPATNLRRGDVPYLAAAVDVSRVRDGDMQCEFVFDRMPFDEERQARFVQTFALSRPPTALEILPMAESDRQLVEQQVNCPIMDTRLGDHGTPIKVRVSGTTFFVCCEGCVEDLKATPELFATKIEPFFGRQGKNRVEVKSNLREPWALEPGLNEASLAIAPRRQVSFPAHEQRAMRSTADVAASDHCASVGGGCCESPTQAASASAEWPPTRRRDEASLSFQADSRWPREPNQSMRAPRLIISDVDDEDTPAIQAQVGCPVSNRPFVSGDLPVKIEIDGQILFVCCRRCAAEVVQRPSLFVIQTASRGR